VRLGLQRGKSLQQIRKDIDKRYEGTQPTPTPMPPAGK
jgi:hypothetical protein